MHSSIENMFRILWNYDMFAKLSILISSFIINLVVVKICRVPGICVGSKFRGNFRRFSCIASLERFASSCVMWGPFQPSALNGILFQPSAFQFRFHPEIQTYFASLKADDTCTYLPACLRSVLEEPVFFQPIESNANKNRENSTQYIVTALCQYALLVGFYRSLGVATSCFHWKFVT